MQENEDSSQKNYWMFANSIDSDYWMFADSKDEAMAEAKENADNKQEDHFVIAKAIIQPPIPAAIAEELLERMDEKWGEVTGSDDYMFERVTQKQKDDLDAQIQVVFNVWAKKYAYKMREWYMPENEEQYTRNNAVSEWNLMADSK